MDQKHALSDILLDMHQLLQQIAGSVACDHCAQRCTHHGTHDGHPTVPSAMPGSEWLDRQGVIDYLQISDRTYYRFKAKGMLQPHRFGQRDYYYIPELAGQLQESIRRGRV